MNQQTRIRNFELSVAAIFFPARSHVGAGMRGGQRAMVSCARQLLQP
ncbi:MAG: hypothetical protein ABIN67_19845 [Ferruginibacter sp.]